MQFTVTYSGSIATAQKSRWRTGGYRLECICIAIGYPLLGHASNGAANLRHNRHRAAEGANSEVHLPLVYYRHDKGFLSTLRVAWESSVCESCAIRFANDIDDPAWNSQPHGPPAESHHDHDAWSRLENVPEKGEPSGTMHPPIKKPIHGAVVYFPSVSQ